MSALQLSLGPCVHAVLGGCIFLFVTLPGLCAGNKNCSHPLVPEHGGFRCEPSPCRGFPLKSTVHYFCESGYVLPPGSKHYSRCRNGEWAPRAPSCQPRSGGKHPEDRVVNSVPSVATTAVGVSIFLLTTTACMVVKSRLYPCQSSSRRSSDQMDLVVDGLPVSLPTYEEAVYGSWGQRLPHFPGPTQLLLAQETLGPEQSSSQLRPDSTCGGDASSQSTEQPPPYEEVLSRSAQGQRSMRDLEMDKVI
ncbi:sushi domain-containing protein 6 [Denticeps clupeoides]|nr:sushi domain-containing protein 6-like [Denticeps clupeoides]XP_028818007.1 sushi domain-containing protein 6-like [Denticeps clupeoides]